MSGPLGSGDRTAQELEQLFRKHSVAILGYLARRVTPMDDAADLMSEVMLTAVRRRDALPSPPEDRLWLYGVARNVLANHRRSARRRTTATEQLAQELRTTSAAVPEPSAEALDVRAALAALGALDREILTLSAWEGLTSGEIATAVELPASTVRARLLRARATVRSRLADSRPASVRSLG